MKIEIDNPCYHCYTGAVGYCREIGCKYEHYSWSEDLETDYKVEYDNKDDKEIKEKMTKEEICNLYHHDCECCPYEIDQIDEEGNIVLDCSYEKEIKEND